MFIADVFPVWGFVVAGIIIIVAIGFAFFITEDFGGGVIALTFAYVGIIFITIIPGSDKVFSNPHQQPSLVLRTEIDKTEMNSFIGDAINADKVSINIEDNNSGVVKSMSEGDIFEFTAIDEDSKINGSFYFTEDSMEIIIENEEEVKEQFSIAID